MLRLLVVFLGAGMIAAAFALVRTTLFRFLRRAAPATSRLIASPTPAWVVTHVPLTRRLSEPQLARLIAKAAELLATRAWVGCGGLVLTDEIRQTIALQAALLVLEHPGEPYPTLREVLVYPATFRPRRFSWTPSADADDRSATLGESWQHGIVVLAWDAAYEGTVNPFDGQNVVLHEFSHQLDPLDGTMDGESRLPSHIAYGTWTAALTGAFQRLNRDLDVGRPTVLDEYAATDPAEFFAVATETFFEKPRRLQREHPTLYAQLSAFYSQDPAAAVPPHEPA